MTALESRDNDYQDTKGRIFPFIPWIFLNLLWLYSPFDEILSSKGLKILNYKQQFYLFIT